MVHIYFQDKLLKPLGGYVGYNTEWRELAQNISRVSIYEPRLEKSGLRGFRPGLTQTGLYSHRSRLEA